MNVTRKTKEILCILTINSSLYILCIRSLLLEIGCTMVYFWLSMPVPLHILIPPSKVLLVFGARETTLKHQQIGPFEGIFS